MMVTFVAFFAMHMLMVLSTLIGGALTATSADTLNCYLDRDIDAMMHRRAPPARHEGRPQAHQAGRGPGLGHRARRLKVAILR